VSDDIMTNDAISEAAAEYGIDAHAVEVHLFGDHGWDVSLAFVAAHCLATGACELLHG